MSVLNSIAHTRGLAESRVSSLPVVPDFGYRAGSNRFGDPLTALYGSVRTLLDKSHAVLHFVSALPGEGTTTVAREFAGVAGMSGHRRTLLLDGNGHNPALARKFQCPTDRGILDGLRDHHMLHDIVTDVGGARFQVGSLSGTGVIQSLHPEEMRSAYTACRTSFDLTVVDCPPVAGGAYADLVPEAADGVILVIQAEASRPAVVAHARNMIEQLGGNIIGAVLNRRKDYIPDYIYRYL